MKLSQRRVKVKKSGKKSGKKSKRSFLRPSHTKLGKSHAKLVSSRTKRSKSRARPMLPLIKRKSPLIVFKFSDKINARDVTERYVKELLDKTTEIIERLKERFRDDQVAKDRINRKIDEIKNKYFTTEMRGFNIPGLRGNDALEAFSEKLHVTPARLRRLIPSISELDPEEVTVMKIRLVLLASQAQELINYLSSI